MKEENYVSENREKEQVVYSVPVKRFSWGKLPNRAPSVKDKILNSKSENEINAHLEKSILTYKGASRGTVNKWKRIAERKIEELKAKKS